MQSIGSFISQNKIRLVLNSYLRWSRNAWRAWNWMDFSLLIASCWKVRDWQRTGRDGTPWSRYCPGTNAHPFEKSRLESKAEFKSFNFEFDMPLPLDLEKYRETYEPSKNGRSMPGKAQIYHRCQVILILRKINNFINIL